MGFFNKKEEEKSEKKVEEKKTSKKAPLKKVKSEDKKEATKKTSDRMPAHEKGKTFDVLIHPWITEKSHDEISDNKYAFKVESRTNKSQIKDAVEVTYDVSVERVNVVNIHAKKRRFGRKVGKKVGFKKAIVTLKKGDKIDFFQGA